MLTRIRFFTAAWLAGVLSVLLLWAVPAVAQHATDGFDPNADSWVNTVALQKDGKIIVGGPFRAMGGESRQYLARLNVDGSVDVDFAATVVDGTVADAVVQEDGSIVIVGAFAAVGGQPRSGIARLTPHGELDVGFAPVLADSPVGTGQPIGISVAEQPDGKLLLGGWFGSVNGEAHRDIARLNADGSVDSGFNPSLNETPRGFVLQPDGKILMLGSFQLVNGEMHSWLVRLETDGSRDPTFNPEPDYAPQSMALQPDGKLIVTGYFETIAGVTQHGIARLNADGSFDVTYAVDTSLFGLYGGLAMAMQPDGKTWVTTRTCDAPPSDVECDSIVRLNVDGSRDTSAARLTFDSILRTVALQADGKLVLGGQFTQVGSESRNRLARLNADGTVDADTRTYADGDVMALAELPDGGVILGGSFTSVTMTAQAKLAKVLSDGSVDTTFAPVIDGDVRAALILSDGRLMIGGDFNTVNGEYRRGLARLNADGSLDATFDAHLNGAVNAMLWQVNSWFPVGRLVIGGDFSALINDQRPGLARVLADGALDATFNPSGFTGEVFALAQQSGGMVLAGGNVVPNPYSRLMRFDINGVRDTAFVPNVALVRALAVQPDGKIIVGGISDTFNFGAEELLRINPDGTPDSTFNTDVNGGVASLVLQTNGSLIVGGAFNAINGVTRNNVARVDATGVVDPDFNPDAKFGRVSALALQADSKLTLGGTFTLLDGQTRYYFGRVSLQEANLRTLSVIRYDDGDVFALWRQRGVEVETTPSVWLSSGVAETPHVVGLMQRIGSHWMGGPFVPVAGSDGHAYVQVRHHPRQGQAGGSAGFVTTTLMIPTGAQLGDGIFIGGFDDTGE